MNEFRNTVAITIQSESIEHNEVQKHMLESKGEWFCKGGFFYLRYHEEDKSTTTLIKWKSGEPEVWVIRQGDLAVRQHFFPAGDVFTAYTTPYGQFVLRTVTHRVVEEVTELGGELYLHFFTQLEDAEPIEHRMKIAFHMLS